jgi:hypothetical protein
MNTTIIFFLGPGESLNLTKDDCKSYYNTRLNLLGHSAETRNVLIQDNC